MIEVNLLPGGSEGRPRRASPSRCPSSAWAEAGETPWTLHHLLRGRRCDRDRVHGLVLHGRAVRGRGASGAPRGGAPGLDPLRRAHRADEPPAHRPPRLDRGARRGHPGDRRGPLRVAAPPRRGRRRRPEYTWLQEITYIGENPLQVRIVGRAGSIFAITNFMSRLETSSFLRDVEPQAIGQQQSETDPNDLVQLFELSADVRAATARRAADGRRSSKTKPCRRRRAAPGGN